MVSAPQGKAVTITNLFILKYDTLKHTSVCSQSLGTAP